MSRTCCPGAPRRVLIVEVNCAEEALTLRQATEWFSLGETAVDLQGVGCCAHLIAALRGEASPAEHVILCCHRDEKGILFPELHPSLAAQEPYVGHFGPEAIRQEARLGGRVVICTGCSTAGLAEAFLDAGASAYIAPRGDPYGAAPLAFLMAFYYRLLACGQDLPTAYRAAHRLGGDCKRFGLFRRG